MAQRRRRTTVKIVKVYNPASALQLKGATSMKAASKKNASRRRSRKSGSRRRRNSAKSTALVRRASSTAVAKRATNPGHRRGKRRATHRRRRNGGKILGLISNPFSRGSVTSPISTGFNVGIGLLSVNALANFNPWQSKFGPWLSVGQKAGIAVLGGIAVDKFTGKGSRASGEIKAGMYAAVILDGASLVLPWVSQRVAAIVNGAASTVQAAQQTAKDVTNMSGLGAPVGTPGSMPSYNYSDVGAAF